MIGQRLADSHFTQLTLTEFKNVMASFKTPFRILQHDKNKTCAAGTGVE